jgi:hypothetical protein
MRYMETIPREPAMTAPSATELIAMRPEIVELGGTERVDNRPSRARGALAIGLLTALVSFGLGGRWFGPTADPAGPTPSAAAQASVEPDPEPVTIDAPLDGDVIRSNVIAVRGHTGIEISEVWLVGRLERLVLGERRASVRDGVITADLMVVAPIDAPVTALDLVIETRDGGRSTTLATRRVGPPRRVRRSAAPGSRGNSTGRNRGRGERRADARIRVGHRGTTDCGSGDVR